MNGSLSIRDGTIGLMGQSKWVRQPLDREIHN